MQFRHLIITATLLLFSFTPRAQQIHAHKDIVKNGYNFWVYTPADYDSNKADKPVLLFLHGASLRGSNMDLALRYGPVDALRRGRNIDAVIINPQCPRGCRWEPDKVIRIVDWVEQHYAVDTNRLYVFGMSLGGYGTLDFVGTYPDRVAAAIAMCGGSHQESYCGLNKLPLWIIHGTADRAVTLAQSQKVVDAMKACSPTDRLIFTKLQGQNHSALARIFYLSEPYEWLFRHRLTDPNRAVCHDYDIHVTDMKSAYKGLTRQCIPIGKSLASKTARYHGGTQCSDAGLASAQEEAMGNGDDSKTTLHARKGTSEQFNEENVGTKQNAVAAKDKKEARQPSGEAKKYHTIRRGDTLSAIARRYHTTVGALCRLNNTKETTVLRIGHKIRVK